MISLEPPPSTFATGPYFCGFLRIGYSPAFNQYFIYDHAGFLCRTDDLVDVVDMLMAESARPNLPDRPFLHYGARDLISPGHAEAWEQQLIQHQTMLTQHKERQRSATPIPKAAGLTGEEVLKKLGLG